MINEEVIHHMRVCPDPEEVLECLTFIDNSLQFLQFYPELSWDTHTFTFVDRCQQHQIYPNFQDKHEATKLKYHFYNKINDLVIEFIKTKPKSWLIIYSKSPFFENAIKDIINE